MMAKIQSFENEPHLKIQKILDFDNYSILFLLNFVLGKPILQSNRKIILNQQAGDILGIIVSINNIKMICTRTIIKLLFLSTILLQVWAKMLPINRLYKTLNTVSQSLGAATTNNNNTAISFQNHQNLIYYIEVQVGSNSQTMGVQFDTGSNVFWLPTQNSNAANAYISTKSNTFTNTTQADSIQYADGSEVFGTYGTDRLVISGTPISITQQFLWVYQENSMNFPQGIQGIVGMGNTNTPNFLDIAYSKGQIATSSFALMIETTTQQSYIFYNDIPESITSQTVYVPVVENGYWSLKVVGVQIGDTNMDSLAAKTAIIDSGTSYFYLNQQLYTAIIQKYFYNCDTSFSSPVCLCSSTSSWPAFYFYFDGVQVNIQPQQYIQPIDNQFCSIKFGTLSTVSQILLGDIFFQQYIITFDKLNSQIGLMGNLKILQNVFPNGDIFSYIFIGIISLLVLTSIIIYCKVQKMESNSDSFVSRQMEPANKQKIQMHRIQNKIQIRQPIL